jgi:hypothetical protein
MSDRPKLGLVEPEEFDEEERSRTKEIGLLQGVDQWVRLYTDLENKVYRSSLHPPTVSRSAVA